MSSFILLEMNVKHENIGSQIVSLMANGVSLNEKEDEFEFEFICAKEI